MKGKFSAKGLYLLTSWAPIEYGNTSFCSLIMVSLLLPPLLDGPAHKCADWGTTCNMVGSFKDVHAIRGLKNTEFLLQVRRKIRFYEHKLIRFWANNIIIKTLRGFHLYLCNLCNLIYSIIALFPDAVELKWQLKWLNQYSFNFAGPQEEASCFK